MFLTDFADAAVTLPLACLVIATLLCAAGLAAACRWAVVVGATFATTLTLKLLFGFWPALAEATDVTSPSGHTAGATIVYAGLVRALGGGRAATLVAASIVAAMVGETRLTLRAHTPHEVLVGAAVGLAGSLLLLRQVPAQVLAGRRTRLALLLCAALVVLVTHGHHAPFEGLLQRLRGSSQHYG